MFKIKSSFFQLVFCFLVCPLLGDNFHRDNPKRAWTFFPLMGGVRYCCPLFRGFFYKGLVLILSGRLILSVVWWCPLFRMSADQKLHCIIEKIFVTHRKPIREAH